MTGQEQNDARSRISPEVDSIVSSILRHHEPTRILLFGSRARNEGRRGSDIDLCVIFERLPKRNVEVLEDLYRELYRVDAGPVDLVVYDEAGFRSRADKPNSFESRIRSEGRAVYGQA
jgi:predicted nucleotidyltransferase